MHFTPETLDKIIGLTLDDETRARAFADLPALIAEQVTPERAASIRAEIEQIIAKRDFRVIGDGDDQAIWQKGWSEVADTMRRADKIGLETLKPQYFHAGVPLRLLGGYWIPQTDYFEYYLGIAVRRALMLRTFTSPKGIVEIGCGTGMNLILAAELHPSAALVGTDWAPASVDILAIIAERLKRDVRGALYDMLTGKGAEALSIDQGTDVLSVHALEQLGAAAPAVIDMLLAKKPRTVLHIEPVLDFYDRGDPYDDIGARYHRARGYLEGLVETLDAHAARGSLEIIARGRVKLGNLYHEAYSFIAWRPA